MMTNPTSRFGALASSPASEQTAGGLIVFLNGASSSGKSSIARELVAVLDEPCFHMPVDAFHAMRSGPEMTPDQPNVVLKRTWMGFHRAVASMPAAHSWRLRHSVQNQSTGVQMPLSSAIQSSRSVSNPLVWASLPLNLVVPPWSHPWAGLIAGTGRRAKPGAHGSDAHHHPGPGPGAPSGCPVRTAAGHTRSGVAQDCRRGLGRRRPAAIGAVDVRVRPPSPSPVAPRTLPIRPSGRMCAVLALGGLHCCRAASSVRGMTHSASSFMRRQAAHLGIRGVSCEYQRRLVRCQEVTGRLSLERLLTPARCYEYATPYRR